MNRNLKIGIKDFHILVKIWKFLEKERIIEFNNDLTEFPLDTMIFAFVASRLIHPPPPPLDNAPPPSRVPSQEKQMKEIFLSNFWFISCLY